MPFLAFCILLKYVIHVYEFALRSGEDKYDTPSAITGVLADVKSAHVSCYS